MKTRDRVAWLALAVLKSVERREGTVRKKAAVRVLTERLGFSERQARNVLSYLLKEQLLIPRVEGLRVSSFQVSAKGQEILERLGLS